MKNLNLLIIGLIISISTMAQSSEWTKTDRNNLYQEAMGLMDKYPNLSKDQKETISLCYLNEVTKKYTKKELDSKIDIEIKRIQESTIITCAKNIGVNLQNNTNSAGNNTGNSELEVTKKNIAGQWVGDILGVFTFREDNTYKKGGCSATWTLSGHKMLISKAGFGCQSYTWDVIKLTNKEMIIYNTKGSLTFSKGNYTFKKVG